LRLLQGRERGDSLDDGVLHEGGEGSKVLQGEVLLVTVKQVVDGVREQPVLPNHGTDVKAQIEALSRVLHRGPRCSFTRSLLWRLSKGRDQLFDEVVDTVLERWLRE